MGRRFCFGSKATEVWVPDQTSGAQAPYFGGLLGPAVRSAAKAATPPQFALRARGQCPLPVCPSPASWLARPGRALCNGVLRHSPGRVGGACLGKKQVGAGCDMRVPSTQPKAGTLPGGYIRGLPPYVCFLPCFLHKQKASRPPGRDRAFSAACGTPLKKVRHRAAAQKEPQRGADSPASWQARPDRALCSGVKATEVWVPDQTSGAQAPFFGGLLGPAARSAAKAATPPQFALRARGQCPLPVCPSPASLVHRSVRAQCRGVLRCGPGRVGGACLGKKQVEAGCDMRVPSTQPKAGTLPGDT